MDALTSNNYAEMYNADYYARYGKSQRHYLTEPMISATMSGLAAYLVRQVKFENHLDVGCAFGLLVSAMRAFGKASFGVDVSEYAIANAIASARRFVWTQDISDVGLLQKYDLITCVEVIEHIPPSREEQFLAEITKASNKIYLSSENNSAEDTHINVHPLSYWIYKMYELGFVPTNNIFPLIPWGRLYKRIKPLPDVQELLDQHTKLLVHHRDLFTCVLCGQRGVHIHEIIPRSFFGKVIIWQCFDEKNRVSLCPECHSSAHTKEARVRLIDTMMQRFNYEYTESMYYPYLQEI